MRRLLREFIKTALEANRVSSGEDDLLLEPDYLDDDDDQSHARIPSKKEVSVAANVAGVTTPLGTDSTHPSGKVGSKRRRK